MRPAAGKPSDPATPPNNVQDSTADDVDGAAPHGDDTGEQAIVVGAGYGVQRGYSLGLGAVLGALIQPEPAIEPTVLRTFLNWPA